MAVDHADAAERTPLLNTSGKEKAPSQLSRALIVGVVVLFALAFYSYGDGLFSTHETAGADGAKTCAVVWFVHIEFTGGTNFQFLSSHFRNFANQVPEDMSEPETTFGVYAFDNERWEADTNEKVFEPIMKLINEGKRGVYQVNAHIAAPSIFQLEPALDGFRQRLQTHQCGFQMVTVTRDPFEWMASAWYKFHDTVQRTPKLDSIVKHEEGWPLKQGNYNYQSYEFLFMDPAKGHMSTLEDLTPERLQTDPALQLLQGRYAKSEEGGPLDGDSSAYMKFLSSSEVSGYERMAIAQIQRLVQKFDIMVFQTEDQIAAFGRLATKFRWSIPWDNKDFADFMNPENKQNSHHDGETHSVDKQGMDPELRKNIETMTRVDQALYEIGTNQHNQWVAQANIDALAKECIEGSRKVSAN